MTDRTQQVLDAMKHIIDPDLGKDIVTLNFIKDVTITDAGKVAFTVELTTPACPVKEQFRTQCQQAVSALPWVTGVEVNLSAQTRRNPLQAKAPGLAKVGAIIAVSSCKGGVGKSTVAVNLAYSMAALGGSVGIFDADVYGPSLPTMVSPKQKELFQIENMIQPLQHEGVRLMSFGFVPSGNQGGAAIMRGPMVTQIINQLLTSTQWGELDYLIIDMPPGTGDIQLTLAQIIPITAALIVTTPQQLSFVDVVKGIQMFDKLNVPTIGVVENMSYFDCPDNGKRYRVFGEGARRQLVEQFGFKNTFELPIYPELSQSGDSGTPLVVRDQTHPASTSLKDIAELVVREVSILKHAGKSRPKVSYRPGDGLVLSFENGEEHLLHPATVRRNCRCALCVDEMTGEPRLRPEDVDDKVFPKAMQPMGNYAVAITWSDGHDSSIYPYDRLLALAAG